jgi:uncharacterized RDD family membrane protein YckC
MRGIAALRVVHREGGGVRIFALAFVFDGAIQIAPVPGATYDGWRGAICVVPEKYRVE